MPFQNKPRAVHRRKTDAHYEKHETSAEDKVHKNGRIVTAACEKWWHRRFGGAMPHVDFARIVLQPEAV